MTETTGDNALQALLARMEALTTEADAKELSYLGNALESLGGKATVFEVLKLGAAEKSAISALSAEQQQALAAQLEQSIQRITAQGDEQDQRIQQAGSTELEKVQQAGQSNMAALAAQVAAEGNRIKGILKGSRPFIFGIAERYGSGLDYTSELGQLHNNQGETLFELLCGLQTDLKYNKWNRPPALQFIQGDSWHYSEQKTQHGNSSHQYSYPMFMLSVLFVKNTTDQAIIRALGRRYSSQNASYGYASVNVGTPDEDSGLNWQTVSSYTGGTSDRSDTVNITIPAGKTVAIVCYNSANFWTSSGGYQFLLRHAFTDMNSFLGNGLEIDIHSTLRAQQMPVSAAQIFEGAAE